MEVKKLNKTMYPWSANPPIERANSFLRSDANIDLEQSADNMRRTSTDNSELSFMESFGLVSMKKQRRHNIQTNLSNSYEMGAEKSSAVSHGLVRSNSVRSKRPAETTKFDEGNNSDDALPKRRRLMDDLNYRNKDKLATIAVLAKSRRMVQSMAPEKLMRLEKPIIQWNECFGTSYTLRPKK